MKFFLNLLPLFFIGLVCQNCSKSFRAEYHDSLSTATEGLEASNASETEVEPLNPEPETEPETAPLPNPLLRLTEEDQIALPKNAQGQTPALPDIGQFVDMPGTGGEVEFTRLTELMPNNSLSHSYAKRSAVDPFNKYIILNSFIYTMEDLQPFKRPPFGYEFVPSQTKRDHFFGFKGGRLFDWNILTEAEETIWNAPQGASNLTIGRWEGEQSADDKYIVVCWTQNGQHQIATIDIANKALVGQIPATSVAGNFNWADTSPSGKYALVGTSSGVYRFDIQLKNGVKLNTRATGDAHGDFMYDLEGNEIFLQEGNYFNGQFSYVRLEENSLHFMDLVDTSTQQGVLYPNSASHISGQMKGQKGKVFISLQDSSSMSSMFVADIAPGQRKVQVFGHSYSTANTYPSEAKASISSDGRTIIWSSDWMGGGQSTYTMMARIKK